MKTRRPSPSTVTPEKRATIWRYTRRGFRASCRAVGISAGWQKKEAGLSAGGRVIGGAGLLVLDWQPSRTEASPVRGRVVNVFVEPEFRRQGLARHLLLGVLDEARRLGVPGIGLSATAEGRPLYASLGFRASDGEMYLETLS